jgi:hypothetical protein
MPYTNDATSDTPAHVVYLIDVSESMQWTIESKKWANAGQSRIEMVHTLVRQAFIQMIRMATVVPEGGAPPQTRPRFQIALFAYHEFAIDIYDGFRPLDEIIRLGMPKFDPAGRTNAISGFQAVDKLLLRLLSSLGLKSPAPLVCHLTDTRRNLQGSALPLAERIRQYQTPDGPVLIENIYLRDGLLRHPINDLKKWPGVRTKNDLVEDPFAHEHFDMSSVIPESYLTRIRRRGFTGLEAGARFMFPGTDPALIAAALAATGVTGQPKR